MNARLPSPEPRRAAAKAPATRDPRPRRAAPDPRWPARPDPRRSARRRLLAEGDVRIKSRGGRLVARAPRCPPVAFWPATGRWAARGGPTRRGLRKLLDFLRHNRQGRAAMPEDPVLYETPTALIGRHEWRLQVYVHPLYGRCTRYRWRRAGETVWREDRDWPSHDGDDGVTGGLPRRLAALYARHRAAVRAALEGRPPPRQGDWFGEPEA